MADDKLRIYERSPAWFSSMLHDPCEFRYEDPTGCFPDGTYKVTRRGKTDAGRWWIEAEKIR